MVRLYLFRSHTQPAKPLNIFVWWFPWFVSLLVLALVFDHIGYRFWFHFGILLASFSQFCRHRLWTILDPNRFPNSTLWPTVFNNKFNCSQHCHPGLLRYALARRPAYTLRMYMLLRMLAPCLANALSRYHPRWDPTPTNPNPREPRMKQNMRFSQIWIRDPNL